MGRDVDGVVRAIMKTTSRVRYRVEYGAGPYVATINPDQIISPGERDAPKDVEF